MRAQRCSDCVACSPLAASCWSSSPTARASMPFPISRSKTATASLSRVCLRTSTWKARSTARTRSSSCRTSMSSTTCAAPVDRTAKPTRSARSSCVQTGPSSAASMPTSTRRPSTLETRSWFRLCSTSARISARHRHRADHRQLRHRHCGRLPAGSITLSGILRFQANDVQYCT